MTWIKINNIKKIEKLWIKVKKVYIFLWEYLRDLLNVKIIPSVCRETKINQDILGKLRNFVYRKKPRVYRGNRILCQNTSFTYRIWDLVTRTVSDSENRFLKKGVLVIRGWASVESHFWSHNNERLKIRASQEPFTQVFKFH